jgi:malate permease and related proteins
VLAIVLACFAAGLLAQRLAPRSTALVPWLDHAVITVTLPALILAKLPELALGTDLLVPVGVAWGCIGLAFAIVLLGARRHGWDRRTTGALLLVTPLGNTTFLGLPMVEALLGKAELTRALAFDQLGTFLALSTYGAVIAAHWGSGDAGWRPVLARLVRFPPFLAVVASFALRWLALPDGLDDALGWIGRFVAPLAMLALGLRFRIAASDRGRTAAVWSLTTKMVVLPLAVLAVALGLGVQRDPAWSASVLEAGMPPMVTAGVVAARAGLDEELATTVVGIGLVIALVTIPLLSLAVR